MSDVDSCSRECMVLINYWWVFVVVSGMQL